MVSKTIHMKGAGGGGVFGEEKNDGWRAMVVMLVMIIMMGSGDGGADGDDNNVGCRPLRGWWG